MESVRQRAAEIEKVIIAKVQPPGKFPVTVKERPWLALGIVAISFATGAIGFILGSTQ